MAICRVSVCKRPLLKTPICLCSDSYIIHLSLEPSLGTYDEHPSILVSGKTQHLVVGIKVMSSLINLVQTFFLIMSRDYSHVNLLVLDWDLGKIYGNFYYESMSLGRCNII